MQPLTGALLIFLLRILDVPIGTLRVMYMVRGDRLRAVPLAFIESLVWVFAISQIFSQLDNRANMVGFAAGFASGTLVGMTLERWIASGHVLARIVSHKAEGQCMAEALRSAGFGVTVVTGTGRGGEQAILFVVALRRRGRELLDVVRAVDAGAFVTIDPVQTAMGGYLPASGASPSQIRK